MIKRSLKVIKEMVKGVGLDSHFENIDIEGVSIESRTVKNGNLYIPIIRIKDGHEYVIEAIKNGATGKSIRYPSWTKSNAFPREVPDYFRF
ncbi:hypothetical protein [Peribacillus acanthi]|uniref:hypothetical protein n=1 Tax=Peribacillus acanthi TaxID=2171554 RepID=UPI000D3E3579|nr:hypothetical protein [Peribacillus acanthi]